MVRLHQCRHMRLISMLTVLGIVTGRSFPEGGQRQVALMDEVEKSIRLPPGADRLQEYGRYYAYGSHSDVIGIYAGRFMGKKAGRQWVSAADRLPHISDGGCGVVNVKLDIKSKHVEAWCNGEA